MALGLNFRIVFAILAGALGSGWQHGYNTGVLNAPQDLITNFIRGECDNSTSSKDDNSTSSKDASSTTATDGEDSSGCLGHGQGVFLFSVVVAIYCVGGIMGGSIVGFVSKTFGRKGGLLLNNILVAVGAAFLGFSKTANSAEMLIAGRLFMGINSGLNAGLCPMYLNEISPVSLRGAVGTVYQLFVTISILLAQVFGMGPVLGNDSGWPWLLALTVVPAIFQVIALSFCPESPKYLLLDKDDEVKATDALTWLRGSVEVHNEMDEMRQEQESAKLIPKVTLKEMITNSSLRRPLVIAMMMMLAQQLSGINAAIFFSTSIFKSAGLGETESQGATLGMGTMNVLMTFVSLAMIEKAGRKTLMLIGLSGMFVTTTLLLISLKTVHGVVCQDPMKNGIADLNFVVPGVCHMRYIAVASVILFVVSFATGPGSIPWFFVTELFTQSGRPIATSLAVAVNWSANFLVGLLFPPLREIIGPWVFGIFMSIQIIFILYVWRVVPETKNKTIEEITAQFRK